MYNVYIPRGSKGEGGGGERTSGHYRQDSVPLRNAVYAMMQERIRMGAGEEERVTPKGACSAGRIFEK